MESINFLSKLATFTLICLPILALADSSLSYDAQMMRGANTAWFNFTETDDGVCAIDHGLADAAAPLLKEIEIRGLRAIPAISMNASQIPDLTVLVAVEANAVPEKVSSGECTIFVKIEAIHSMSGIPRHHQKPIVLRVLAYRSFWFGTIRNTQVTEALRSTALHAIAKFGDEYFAANKP